MLEIKRVGMQRPRACHGERQAEIGDPQLTALYLRPLPSAALDPRTLLSLLNTPFGIHDLSNVAYLYIEEQRFFIIRSCRFSLALTVPDSSH
jgi:hypothetical protein